MSDHEPGMRLPGAHPDAELFEPGRSYRLTVNYFDDDKPQVLTFKSNLTRERATTANARAIEAGGSKVYIHWSDIPLRTKTKERSRRLSLFGLFA